MILVTRKLYYVNLLIILTVNFSVANYFRFLKPILNTIHSFSPHRGIYYEAHTDLTAFYAFFSE